MTETLQVSIEPVVHLPSPRAKVFMAFPGASFCWGTVRGALLATQKDHELFPENNGNGWDDFNALWAHALNVAEAGGATHFAMLHSDVSPQPGWVDVLLEEMESHDADMVSCVVPIKDERGLTSCGIGLVDDPWNAYKRFTIRELESYPETFSIAETWHKEKFLLHNTGCWVADLRKAVFYETNEQGALKAFFDFPTGIVRGKDGTWVNLRESEDWFFSRQLHLLGASTWITRKVKLTHSGIRRFPNYGKWGTYDTDRDCEAAREAVTHG